MCFMLFFEKKTKRNSTKVAIVILNVARILQHSLSYKKMRITMVIFAPQTWHPASIGLYDTRIAQDSQNAHVRTAPVRSQHVAPPGTLRSSRERLMQLLPLPIPFPRSCRCWHGRLAVLILAAAVVAVVVPRL